MPDAQIFGGNWTEEKLRRVSAYMQAYTTALKNQSFQKVYIDAFAGSGYGSRRRGTTTSGTALFPGMKELVKGSARRALEVSPPFDRYIFIEKDSRNFAQLQSLREEVPQMAGAMKFLNEDANLAIKRICEETNWRNSRAVMFLDPFGMQVDWSTLTEIAGTEGIDLWYLFPVGAAQRLLKKQGDISDGWRRAITRFLGDEEWESNFYQTSSQATLFGSEDRREKVADVTTFKDYMNTRLSKIFKGGVASNPLELRNSKGSCMFLLLFACGNPKAGRLALRVAQYILGS